MRDLWIWQFGSTQLTRFTLEPSVETAPIWTPDGKRLVFASNQVDGRFNLWWQAADGSGSAERLTSNPYASFPTGVSPDGKLVVYWTSTPTAGRDLMTVSPGSPPEPPLNSSRRVTSGRSPLHSFNVPTMFRQTPGGFSSSSVNKDPMRRPGGPT